jgi:hypothetical protein
MQRLSDLTAINISKAITIVDNRPAQVIFDDVEPIEAVDQIIVIDTTAETISPAIDIVEIVNYAVTNVRFRVTIFTSSTPLLTGSTISWPNYPGGWPANLTLTQVDNVYTVSGFISGTDWNAVRQFTWNLPANYASSPNFRLISEIIYFDPVLGQDQVVSWKTYDPRYTYIAELEAKATMTCSARVTYRPSLALSTQSTCVLNQPLHLEIFQNYNGGYGDNSMFNVVGTGIIVDWGDGSSNTYGTLTDGSFDTVSGAYPKGLTHVYNSSGFYIVKIYGNITKFRSRTGPKWNAGVSTTWRVITQVIGWPFSNITNLSLAGAALTYVPAFLPSSVTNADELLSFGTTTGTAATNIASWNVRNISYFNSAFSSTSQVDGFNTDISGWHTRNAVQMDAMFYNNNKFNRNLSSWDVRNIPTEPTLFRTGATAWTLAKPVWGTRGTWPLTP